MLKMIFKKSKVLMIIIVTAITFNMLTISFVISNLNYREKLYSDENYGSSQYEGIIKVNNFGEDLNIDRLLNICKQFKDSCSVIIGGFCFTSKGKDIYDIPVEAVYLKKCVWKPPIDSGRYLTREEFCNGENSAVVGNDLLNISCFRDEEFYIGEKKFKIVGYVGNKFCKVPYSGEIFIPVTSITDDMKKDVKEVTIRIYNSKDINNKVADFKQALKDENLMFYDVDNPAILNYCKSFVKLQVIVFLYIAVVYIGIYNIYKSVNKIYSKNKDFNYGEDSVMIFAVNVLGAAVCISIHYLIYSVFKKLSMIINYEKFAISQSNILFILIYCVSNYGILKYIAKKASVERKRL